jgi:hypothetical protein
VVGGKNKGGSSVTSELFTVQTENYANLDWLGLEEIEYIISQPVEEAHKNGLNLYYPMEGWQSITQADIPIGKLFIAGHFRIHAIEKKIFEIEYTGRSGSYLERRLYLSCGLYVDGFTRFRLPFDVLDNLWNVTDIEDINAENPPVNFDKEVHTTPYNCPERPPLNYFISNQLVCNQISTTVQQIRSYCERNFVTGYEERIQNCNNAASSSQDEERNSHYIPNKPLENVSASQKVNDEISTQGRNSLIRTTRALAKCLISELDDVPTPSQLKELIKLMEEEHNDIPCTEKTLKSHLINPD